MYVCMHVCVCVREREREREREKEKERESKQLLSVKIILYHRERNYVKEVEIIDFSGYRNVREAGPTTCNIIALAVSFL